MPFRRPLPTHPIARRDELRRRRAGRFGVATMMVLMAVLTLPEILATPTYSVHLPAATADQAPPELPDGSRVVLETGTALEVQYYKHRREVRLSDGAAEFTINKDADRPFEAKAGGVVARTDEGSFGLRRAGSAVRVEVRSGTVEVSEGRWNRRKSVVLQAGQGVQTRPEGGLTEVFIVTR
ncbi:MULTISPECIES: FecR family protein [unclassified Achromobacter]|uniref:FecR family protein n=1 Tax=unclassified Achromobacter TaxID=2626865 RepID=UPI0013038CAC|nr:MULTISPECIES: FecR domain-containing protein [unclassified Achromobacter]